MRSLCWIVVGLAFVPSCRAFGQAAIGAVPAPAEARPAATAPAATTAAVGEVCLDQRDWYRAGASIEFAGRRFDPAGNPEPISRENLATIGRQDGVPLYVGLDASPPYVDLWLPICQPPDTYKLYTSETG